MTHELPSLIMHPTKSSTKSELSAPKGFQRPETRPSVGKTSPIEATGRGKNRPGSLLNFYIGIQIVPPWEHSLY